MPEIKNCETCAHGKFDKLWGEYKCMKFQHRIYDVRKKINCGDWVKNEKKEDVDESIDV